MYVCEAIFVHRKHRTARADIYALFAVYFDPFHKLRGKGLLYQGPHFVSHTSPLTLFGVFSHLRKAAQM